MSPATDSYPRYREALVAGDRTLPASASTEVFSRTSATVQA